MTIEPDELGKPHYGTNPIAGDNPYQDPIREQIKERFNFATFGKMPFKIRLRRSASQHAAMHYSGSYKARGSRDRTNFIRQIPLWAFTPLRQGVARLPRDSLLRKGCTAVLKIASKGQSIGDRLSEIRPLDDPTISFVACDSMVIDEVYWFGLRGYEGILVDLWGALAERANSILEIGGNIGFYSVIGGRRAKAAYSVIEPIPENVAILRENLVRNGIFRVDVIEAAVIPFNEPQKVRLNIPDEGRDAPVGAHLFATEALQRSTLRVIETDGIPIAHIARDRDLIKIDAEGIEAELIAAMRDHIFANHPTLVLEVLPEAEKLAATVREIAAAYGGLIHIIPAWGSDRIISVGIDEFTSHTPQAYNSKDIILSRTPLPVFG